MAVAGSSSATRAAAAWHAAWRVLVLNVVAVPLLTVLTWWGDGRDVASAVFFGAMAGCVHAVAQAVAVVYADRERRRRACTTAAVAVALLLVAPAMLWVAPFGIVPYVAGMPFAVRRWVVPDDRPPERR